MSLKPIPVESTPPSGQKQKHFNPGSTLKKHRADGTLKHLCLRLIHFVNRGSRFTFEQIDELIMSLERSILSLRKKKQEMMRKKNRAR